jgi:hypothetical protein
MVVGWKGSKHEFETWHVSKVQVLNALARAWEFVSGCLGLNNTFTICHSNNVKVIKTIM